LPAALGIIAQTFCRAMVEIKAGERQAELF
jgi:hypothetical protein